jgi:hypothetical protein
MAALSFGTQRLAQRTVRVKSIKQAQKKWTGFDGQARAADARGGSLLAGIRSRRRRVGRGRQEGSFAALSSERKKALRTRAALHLRRCKTATRLSSHGLRPARSGVWFVGRIGSTPFAPLLGQSLHEVVRPSKDRREGAPIARARGFSSLSGTALWCLAMITGSS